MGRRCRQRIGEDSLPKFARKSGPWTGPYIPEEADLGAGIGVTYVTIHRLSLIDFHTAFSACCFIFRGFTFIILFCIYITCVLPLFALACYIITKQDSTVPLLCRNFLIYFCVTPRQFMVY